MSLDKDLERYEVLLIINELSEIIRHHTDAVQTMNELTDKFPKALTESQINLVRDSLRDNQNMLLREFNSLQQGGRDKKKYDKRYVCKQCHSVFLMPLPGGICDECRSKKTGNAYDTATLNSSEGAAMIDGAARLNQDQPPEEPAQKNDAPQPESNSDEDEKDKSSDVSEQKKQQKKKKMNQEKTVDQEQDGEKEEAGEEEANICADFQREIATLRHEINRLRGLINGANEKIGDMEDHLKSLDRRLK